MTRKERCLILLILTLAVVRLISAASRSATSSARPANQTQMPGADAEQLWPESPGSVLNVTHERMSRVISRMAIICGN